MTDDQQPPQAAPPGWYPDPWSTTHHRYWDGSTWTRGAFPHGPANPWSREGIAAAEAPTEAPAAARDTLPYLPWSPLPPADGSVAAPANERGEKRARWTSGVGFVALVIGVMVVVGSLGTLGGYLAFRHRSNNVSRPALPPAFTPTTPGSVPSGPRDASAAALGSLVLAQQDVPSTYVVQPRSDSGQVSAIAGTLDLCNGSFPSESLRTARVQTGAYDGAANEVLSTEAVLYTNAAATEQAFSELMSAAANCPSSPVASPIGGPTLTTRFSAPPDGAWAETPSVTRLAYDFVLTDESGATEHHVTVYLRRGRALMAVYFAQPDSPQVPVSGQTTMEKIAGVFAERIAALPASVVNG